MGTDQAGSSDYHNLFTFDIHWLLSVVEFAKQKTSMLIESLDDGVSHSRLIESTDTWTNGETKNLCRSSVTYGKAYTEIKNSWLFVEGQRVVHCAWDTSVGQMFLDVLS